MGANMLAVVALLLASAPATSGQLPGCVSEIMFLLDGSLQGLTSSAPYERMIEDVILFVTTTFANYGNTQIGFVTYGSTVTRLQRPLPIEAGAELRTNLVSAQNQFPAGQIRSTELGLNRTIDILIQRRNPIESLRVPMTIIVISFGLSSDPTALRVSADVAQAQGVNVYTLGIYGSFLTNGNLRQQFEIEMQYLASVASQMSLIGDVSQLSGTLLNLPRDICKVRIITAPSSLTVYTLQTIVLEARLNQRGITTGRWLKNGVAFTAATSSERLTVFTDGDTKRLTIVLAEESDSGVYTFEIGDVSVSFTVTVTAGVIGLPPSPFGNLGGTLSLPILLANPDCNPTAGAWTFNQVTLTPPSAKYLYLVSSDCRTHTLQINNLQITDSGEYTFVYRGQTVVISAVVSSVVAPIDGGFSQWTLWSSTPCSVSCGTSATKTVFRRRECNNPVPQNNGRPCTGNAREDTVVNCGLTSCPINGGLSQWSQWNTVEVGCPLTCGQLAIKLVSRSRTCTSPITRFGGVFCTELLREARTQSCGLTNDCPTVVDGGLSDWGQWIFGSCASTCGENELRLVSRSRTCTNPPPSPSGQPCDTADLNESTFVNCGFRGCPVDGGFTQWGPWNANTAPCFFTCGVSVTKTVNRFRTCTSPRPSNGGRICVGDRVDTQEVFCNLPACQGPVNGVLSQWSAWNVGQVTCDVTCGLSALKLVRRFRTCTPPQNGGIPCLGSTEQTTMISCGWTACRINGGPGSWGAWSDERCPQISCGITVTRSVFRTRPCDNPVPQNGGAECEPASLFETKEVRCDTPACPTPVDGGVTAWGSWFDLGCNGTCGNAVKVLYRNRSCTNPIPRNGGRDCVELLNDESVVSCGFRGCPVNGGFSAWGQWGAAVCTLTCGVFVNGISTRTRRCDNPSPQNDGLDCFGDLESTAFRQCTLPSCPVIRDGGVSAWSAWEIPQCGVSCGRDATKSIRKTRRCDNPFPSPGGRSCEEIGLPLEEIQVVNCGLTPCPVDGGVGFWTEWVIVACVKTCGINEARQINRTRRCDNPAPSNGGGECVPHLFESSLRSCDLPKCPEPKDGTYTQWTAWVTVTCRATCGRDINTLRTRSRTCIPPTNGGRECSVLGPPVEAFFIPCPNLQPCEIHGGISEWTQWGTPICPLSCGSTTTQSVIRERFCNNPVPQNNGDDCRESRRESRLASCTYPPCPVPGGISQWTAWSTANCPLTCGGFRTVSVFRQRFCNSPVPQNGGAGCIESRSETQPANCNYNPCPIDGGISLWSQWSNPNCPASCGSFVTVTVRRDRRCNNPTPQFGGQDCLETRREETKAANCNYPSCPVDGGISQWTTWTNPFCPLSCGPPTLTLIQRQRFCNNPPPAFEGQTCLETLLETRSVSCNYSACATDGGISQWTAWTIARCPLTCGGFATTTVRRFRYCDNPPPSVFGRTCFESREETRAVNCNYTACPVDGGYSQWNQWTFTGCGFTCGLSVTRTATRRRFCTNPQPSPGGRNCLGPATESYTENCRLPSCAVDGGISQWTEWVVQPCGRSCGPFTTVSATRQRFCTSPSPTNGGVNCTQSRTQTVLRSCNYVPCPINGGYTQWTQWNIPQCALTCGSSLTRTWTRSRTCTSPQPQYGGAGCVGPDSGTFEENCNLPFCTVDGGISQWTQWVVPTCPFSCAAQPGSVVAIRRRYCNQPPFTDGGRNCSDSRQETQLRNCDYPRCPVNGGYTAWTNWAIPACTATCGVDEFRIITRERFCSSPSPQFEGRPCTDPRTQSRTRNCLLRPCPINGGVSDWTLWIRPPCPATCGFNIQRNITRYRFCDNPWPLYGGSSCPGIPLTQTIPEQCTLPTCAVDGGFSGWSSWGTPTCVRTCGAAFGPVSRSRTCTEPVPVLGGRNCTGLFSESTSRSCNLTPCPINGGFQIWSAWVVPSCIISCGPNIFVTGYRSRSCSNPVAQNNGQDCVGARWETVSRSCNLSPCPVNGGFTQWTSWSGSACPQSCGPLFTRVVSRSRSCTNPSPSGGGRQCIGQLQESTTRNCALPNCPIDGSWSLWANWTDPSCQVTCGPTAFKVSTRVRTCSQPAPRYGGRICVGPSQETQTLNCGLPNCPLDGGLTPWTRWTDPPCPRTCGSSEQKLTYRFRTCSNPVPQFNGQDCIGGLNETRLVSCGNNDCPVDGGFTVWTVWNNPPCPFTCGSGMVKEVRRFRECTNPAPRFGGKSCEGNIEENKLVSCNVPQCGIGLLGLCTAAQIINGVGYRYHPTDCDKYIQCYYNSNLYVIGVYRSCPFGYYWDGKTLRCDLPWKVQCPLEKCDGTCVQNYNMEGSCRAHWVCEKKVSRGECCPMGFRYVLGQGCKPDFYCRDVCPTPCASRDVCDKRPDWDNNPMSYNISVGLLGWLRASCVSGTYFDLMECGCGVPTNASCTPDYNLNFDNEVIVRDALSSWLVNDKVEIMSGYARFDGTGHLFFNISQKAPAFECPFILRFRFTETIPLNGRRILASTKDCYSNNALVIAIDEADVVFEMTSVFGHLFRMPISLAGFRPFEWKTVTLMYDGNMITGVVESNDLRYMARQFAPETKIMECGFRFASDGSLKTTENFVGALDSISVYRCNPGNLLD